MSVSSRLLPLLGVLILAAALPGCRIVKNNPVGAPAAQNSGQQDAKGRVDAIWDAKLIPYAQAKAAPYPELARAIAAAPEQAVHDHGFRAPNADAKAALYTRIEGVIVGGDSKSRVGTIEVDVDGDGKPDVTVQIGPILRGTVLRDSLDFVSFDSFTNQIDYADFSKALNARVRDQVLKGLPREGLIGRHVSLVGAFFLGTGSQPVVTPVLFKLGDKTP